jgi:hypothetical protein
MANNAGLEALNRRFLVLCSVTSDAPSAAAVQAFISGGADVNTKHSGSTVLMLTSARGYIDAVKTLLANDININLKNNRGHTALMLACMKGHIEVVKVLLAAHSLNPTNDFINDTNTLYRMTVLMIACENSRAEIIKLLLSIPTINIHLKDYDAGRWGTTALGRWEIGGGCGKTALDLVKGKPKEDEIKALFHGECVNFLPSLTFTLLSSLLLALTILHCLSLCSHSIAFCTPRSPFFHSAVSFFLSFLRSFREQVFEVCRAHVYGYYR